ncbi:hypothetical protein DYST_00985 [Dyella terrae]|nr:hypothetical protein DYST_00985 [Dyella terrae]
MPRLVSAAVLLAAACSASARDDSEVHPSYFDGSRHRYEYTITAEMVDLAPKWNQATQPNPPLSASEAIAKSRECIAKIPPGQVDLGVLGNTGKEYWALTEVSLRKVLNSWAWVITYGLTPAGPATGAWPTMDCWVLMDGKVLKPGPVSMWSH